MADNNVFSCAWLLQGERCRVCLHLYRVRSYRQLAADCLLQLEVPCCMLHPLLLCPCGKASSPDLPSQTLLCLLCSPSAALAPAGVSRPPSPSLFWMWQERAQITKEPLAPDLCRCCTLRKPLFIPVSLLPHTTICLAERQQSSTSLGATAYGVPFLVSW